jgi:hypothetical protein
MNRARVATGPKLDTEVAAALAWLKAHGTQHTLDGMARYAIPSHHACQCTTSPSTMRRSSRR